LNLKTTYEEIITEKLEQALPIPDMADAIWARIEMQLDATPDADGDASPSVESIPAKAIMGKTLAIVIGGILTLIVLFILLKKNAKKREKTKEPPPVQQTIKVNPGISSPDTASNTGSLIKPAAIPDNPVKPGTISNSDATPFLKKDSTFNQPLQNIQKDSTQSAIIPRTVTMPSDSGIIVAPPYKKPRGVPGISNDDYKILGGKKDSLIKKN
jgi:hypothetical protein